ncbi:MAG: glycosyltransferase, partial [Brevundimonas sp.]
MSVLHLLGTAGDGGAETYFLDLVGALAGAGVSQAAAIRAHAGREARLAALGVPGRTLRLGGPVDILTRPSGARFARAKNARVALAW